MAAARCFPTQLQSGMSGHSTALRSPAATAKAPTAVVARAAAKPLHHNVSGNSTGHQAGVDRLDRFGAWLQLRSARVEARTAVSARAQPKG